MTAVDPLFFPVTVQNIADVAEADGLALGDIDDDGEIDALVVSSVINNSAAIWLNQITEDNWTAYTIFEKTDGQAKFEGCLLIDIDDDGVLEAVIADQNGGTITLCKHGGDPTVVPWTSEVLLSNVPKIQTVFALDIDGDGVDEIVYACEGSAEGQGRIGVLDLPSGSALDDTNYTDTTLIQHDGAWQIVPRLIDLSGSGRGDLVFSARSNSNEAAEHGIYWIEQPATWTDAWTRHTVFSNGYEWTHLDVGDFAGSEKFS